MGEARQGAEARAWTVEEMRKGSGNWSLASDAGMLQHLQEYSQKMISRTHDIQKQVTALLNEAKLTSVRVNNTFNDFIMLANTQFVENRVYDDDVTQDPESEEAAEKKEKTKEEREAELVPRVATAMRLGLGVIDSAFEKLDMNEANSDSEEEEAGYRPEPLLEAKDPYLSRPLPYMIGSPSFLQDDDVGLIDFPSEDEEEAPPEESESETESESDGESPVTQQRVVYSDSDGYSEGSDLFHGEDSEDDLEAAVRPPARSESEEEVDTPRDFASELAAKITAAPVAPPDSNQEKHTSPKKKKEKKKQEGKPPDEDDLFGPPSRSLDAADEDADSPFGQGAGLFSSNKGGGLFDDEDDLFGDVTAPPQPQKAEKKQQPPPKPQETSSSEDEAEPPAIKPPSKKPPGGVSMFGGEDPDDLFSMPTGETAPSKARTPQPSKQAPPTRQSAGLFDNSEEEEDDFFAAVGNTTKVKSTAPTHSGEKSLNKGLFDDDEGDLFDDPPPKQQPTPTPSQGVKTQPEKKLPVGAVSMFGGNKNPLLDALKAKQRPEASESEDGWSDDDKKSSQSGASKSSASFKSANQKPSQKATNPSMKTKPRSASASSNSLFADEGDDLFETVPSKPTKKPAPSSTGPPSIFDEDEEDDLFNVKPKPKAPVDKSQKKSALFQDEAEDEPEDIFAVKPPPVTDQQPSKKKPVGGVSLFGGADLFGDSLPKSSSKKEEEPPQPSPTSTQSQPQSQPNQASKPGMIDSAAKETNKKGAGPKKAPGLSLFDDGNDEEEDDIFAQVTKTSSAAKTPALFGGDDDDDITQQPKPKVDLKPKVTEKPSSSKKPDKSADLFNEDSDEDLFGDAQPQKQASKPADKPVTPASSTQRVAGATTTASHTDQLTESGDEDLFTETKKPMVAEPSKPKKPAGAVSMFGSIDPNAMFGKKAASSTQQNGPTSSEGVSSTDPLSSQTSSQTPASPAKALSAGVQNLQARLAINPTSLLPGASPPVQEVSDTGVGFDDPPQEKTLHSVVKDRAKLRPGRRPPTRQGRKSRISQAGPEFADTAGPSSQNITGSNNLGPPSKTVTGSNDLDIPDSRVPAAGLHPQTNEDIHVFMGTSQGQTNSSMSNNIDVNSGKKKSALFDDELDNEDDIFASTGVNKTDKSTVQDHTQSGDVIDTAGDENTDSGDITTTEKVQSWLEHSEPVSKPSSKSVFEDGDEDIFASPKVPSHGESDKSASQTSRSVRSERSATVSSHHSTISSKSSSKAKSSSGKEGSVRSIPVSNPLENGLPSNQKESKPESSAQSATNEGNSLSDKTKKPRIKPTLQDDDDDLFTSSKLSAKPKAPKVYDDDDDLFSSAKLTAPSKVAAKAEIEDDIFSTAVPVSKKKVETDDIFADIMSSSQPTKPVAKVTPDENNIFSDTSAPATVKEKPKQEPADVDDIFADLGSQPVTQQQPTNDLESSNKASKKSKKSKKSVVKDEDIFKDDTDIFADIPAAKPKQAKTKKAKTQPLFGGETDDIFAQSSSTATKSKKSKKSQKSSAAAAAAAFDKDAPNIFDDPLSALDS